MENKKVSPDRFVRFVRGHAFGDTFHSFPHDCPGRECAIRRWLSERQLRRDLEATAIVVDRWQPKEATL